MHTPAVSVLLPVYNDAGTVSRSIRSIRAQTFDDWELLVLDDGSTDGARERIRPFCRRDGRIRCLSLPHRGLPETLNAGLEVARGRLIARMDADDVSHPQRLDLQKMWLDRRPEIAAVSCRVRLFPRRSISDGMRAYEAWLNSLTRPEEIARDIFVESPLAHPSVLARRDVLEEVGGYRRGGPEDYDLWLRLHRRGHRFGKVPRFLLWWMDRPERISRRSPDYSREAFRRCKARHLAGLLGPGACVILVGNREARRMAVLLREKGVRVKGFVDIDPGRIGSRRKGVPVWGYEHLARHRPDCLVLSAVGSPGARELIRGRLAGLGFREGEEFLCVG